MRNFVERYFASKKSKSLISKLDSQYSLLRKEEIREAFNEENRFYTKTMDRIKYINDKNSTRLNSLWYALSLIPNSYDITLIAGGIPKEESDKPIDEELEKVKYFIDIGEKPTNLYNQIKKGTPIIKANNAQDAIEKAKRITESGNIVLISPGHPSFDRFEDKEDRYIKFKLAIDSL